MFYCKITVDFFTPKKLIEDLKTSFVKFQLQNNHEYSQQKIRNELIDMILLYRCLFGEQK